MKKSAAKAKASPKTAAKAPSKSVAKPVAKPAPKKPVVKASVAQVNDSKRAKSAPAPKVTAPVKAKVAAKTPTPAPPKLAVKAAPKSMSPAKAVEKKTTQPPKTAAKTVKATPSTKKAPVQLKTPAAKPPVSSKVVPVTASKTVNSKSSAAPSTASKAATSASAPSPSPSAAEQAAIQAIQAATAAGVPARSTRPSSRLTQLTVPSMDNAGMVASTAAKASFSAPPTLSAVPSYTPIAIKKDPKLANNWKTKPVESLTDAEVIAMSDDDYMNEVQVAYFRLKLVQLRQSMLNNAGQTTENLREDTVVVPDPADRATIEEEHALELRTRDRERKLLKKIEQSISRIDAGDYGYCDETGEPIGVGRLLARPTATLSLEAQQRRELKQKMFGD